MPDLQGGYFKRKKAIVIYYEKIIKCRNRRGSVINNLKSDGWLEAAVVIKIGVLGITYVDCIDYL
jgi:hypothetical protein